eukprot:gene1414-biopygen7972
MPSCMVSMNWELPPWQWGLSPQGRPLQWGLSPQGRPQQWRLSPQGRPLQWGLSAQADRFSFCCCRHRRHQIFHAAFRRSSDPPCRIQVPIKSFVPLKKRPSDPPCRIPCRTGKAFARLQQSSSQVKELTFFASNNR